MPIPDPTEPRTFKLTDDTCFSGIRINPDDRKVDGVDGGGYIQQGTRRLTPAHGFVYAPVAGSRPGEVVVTCEANLTVAEREAMREMVWRVEGGSRTTERS